MLRGEWDNPRHRKNRQGAADRHEKVTPLCGRLRPMQILAAK